MLPDRKARWSRVSGVEGRVVAMAGDGVSDAPRSPLRMSALRWARAPTSPSRRRVTLLKGDLTGIVRARACRSVCCSIRQNLFFAFIYNGLGVPVAAGVLYPAFGILLSPVIAAAAMALSSVSVIANASRLRTAEL